MADANKLRSDLLGPGRHSLGSQGSADSLELFRQLLWPRLAPNLLGGCDHQLAQDVYSGAVVSAKTFARTQFMFDVQSDVPASESDGTCESPWARAAKTAMASQTIGRREGYTPKTV